MYNRKYIDNILMEDAQVVFRTNFSGENDGYGSTDRYFNVRIDDPEVAQQLIDDGWRVKTWVKKDDPDAEPVTFLKVKVAFGKYPPEIRMILGRTNNELDEESVKTLDRERIKSCDLLIRPYISERVSDGKITAYLKRGCFVVEQDEFASMIARKYSTDLVDDEIPFD